MAEEAVIEFVDYKPTYYSLDHLWRRGQNLNRQNKTHEDLMNNRLADTWKPLPTSLPRRPLAGKIRFVAGIAIALGGAAVFLSDLFALVPSFG